jgi:hypothetical protein
MEIQERQIDDGGVDPTECIAACEECSRSCLQHVPHCLDLGGEHAQAAHITQLLGCAAVCRTAVELMTLGSDWAAAQCELCAQTCDDCADCCAGLDNMEDCVAACRSCAAACRDMLSADAAEEEETTVATV